MLAFPLFLLLAGDSSGAADVKAWRAHQEQKMRGDKSPFAVERVEILDHDHSTLGSGANATVKLPGEGIPPVAGEVVIRGKDAVLIPSSPLLTVNGKQEKEHVLIGTDWVALGSYRLQIRHPDGKIALRIANLKGKAMMSYSGLKYFDYNEHYRVPAQFTPLSGKHELTVDSSQGGPQQLPYVGKLTFKLDGQSYTLDAFIDDDEPDVLFIIFRDASSGKETYGVGRYVYVARTPNGETILDFNKAFNPLCAYGPMFFCPIPPKQNHLPVAILAGEKPYSHH